MFELVILACLTGDHSDVCAPRVLPTPDPTTRAECQATARTRSEAWPEDHPGHTVESFTCAALDEIHSAFRGRSRAGRIPKTEESPLHPFSLVEVAPGVHVHEGGIGIPDSTNLGDLANLGVIIGEESVAVIDAGGSRAVGEALYIAIRRLTNKPIRTVIFTHMHPDHTLGAELFAEAGATIIAHKKLDRGLRARASNYEATLDELIGREGFLGTRPAFPTKGVDGSEKIDLGGRVLELRSWPTAHTDNDLTVFDPQTGTLFAGDLVFADHTPALDGSLVGWIKVLKEMDWPIERVVPGHGPPSIPWPEGGKPTRDYLDVLAKDTRDAILRGESIGKASKHIAESERAKWKLFNEFNARNATAAFKELEWE